MLRRQPHCRRDDFLLIFLIHAAFLRLTDRSLIKPLLRSSSPFKRLTLPWTLIPLRTGIIARCFLPRLALNPNDFVQKLLILIKMSPQHVIDLHGTHANMQRLGLLLFFFTLLFVILMILVNLLCDSAVKRVCCQLSTHLVLDVDDLVEVQLLLEMALL